VRARARSPRDRSARTTLPALFFRITAHRCRLRNALLTHPSPAQPAATTTPTAPRASRTPPADGTITPGSDHIRAFPATDRRPRADPRVVGSRRHFPRHFQTRVRRARRRREALARFFFTKTFFSEPIRPSRAARAPIVASSGVRRANRFEPFSDRSDTCFDHTRVRAGAATTRSARAGTA